MNDKHIPLSPDMLIPASLSLSRYQVRCRVGLFFTGHLRYAVSSLVSVMLMIPSSTIFAAPAPPSVTPPSPTLRSEKGTQPRRSDPRAHLGTRELSAVKRQGEVVIDGRLDEEAWTRAKESVGFVERVPNPGDTPPVESSVKVLYDDSAIYVGVRLNYDPEYPPVAWEMRRDTGSLWSDDAITLKIDPRRDKRTTLGFALNAAGAYLDLIALDNGRSFLTQYDMVWEGSTSIGDRAWYAEYRIPYAALAFEADDPNPEPGIALSRDHPARQATDDWTLLPPEFGPASAMHYGTLKGLKDVDGGRPLVLMPYVSFSGLDAAQPIGGLTLDDRAGGRIGGEMRAYLGEGAWAELSVLTDFAQVDLDNALLNLTRFPLFFPERRAFFLNGTDVFTFGTSSSRLFFSRRIGLTADGSEVPIYGGAKIYSRSGQFRYGVLSTLSGLSPAGVADPEAGLESANIGRARLEILDGYAGVILTHQHRTQQAEPFWETGYGIDLNQRFFNKRLELSGAYSGLMNPEVTEDERRSLPQSGNAEIKWRGEDYQSRLSYLYVDEDYLPRLGFVRRPNVSLFSGGIDRVFYKPLGLNRITLGVVTSASWDAHFTKTLDRDVSGSLYVRSREGWTVDAMMGYVDRVVVREDFELSGIAIDPGHYTGPSGYFSIATPYAGARWSASVLYLYDSAFFNGINQTLVPSVRLSLSRHLRLTADYTYSRLSLPRSPEMNPDDSSDENGSSLQSNGTFQGSEHAVNGGLVITPDINTQIDLVGQLNTQADRWMGLARLRWRWAPGSDLFLVYRLKSVFEEGTPSTMSMMDTSMMDMGMSNIEMMSMMGRVSGATRDRGWRVAQQQLMFKMVWRVDTLY